jgi:hypothetical protein
MGRVEERLAAGAVPGPGGPAATDVGLDRAPDAGAPIGPAADEEAALLATQREVAPEAVPLVPREEPTALPPLEALVARIPPVVRDTLDDLFRAKFTAVRRVPPSALK